VPISPWQLQLQGWPLPETADGVPKEQRRVGAIAAMVWPWSPPQAPGTESRVKVAVTSLAASMVRMQLPVPVQAPLQPMKPLPKSGKAVRVIVSPGLIRIVPLAPLQVRAPVSRATSPLPVPVLVTASFCWM